MAPCSQKWLCFFWAIQWRLIWVELLPSWVWSCSLLLPAPFICSSLKHTKQAGLLSQGWFSVSHIISNGYCISFCFIPCDIMWILQGGGRGKTIVWQAKKADSWNGEMENGLRMKSRDRLPPGICHVTQGSQPLCGRIDGPIRNERKGKAPREKHWRGHYWWREVRALNAKAFTHTNPMFILLDKIARSVDAFEFYHMVSVHLASVLLNQ